MRVDDRSRSGVRAVLVVLLTAGLSAAAVQAGGWPQWRGPTWNGVSTEKNLISSWSAEGENLIWKNNFMGRSTPVVLDGRVCVIGRVGESTDRQEVVACYDAGDGTKVWEDRFNVYHTTVPFNRVGWASLGADRETGNLYAQGVGGQLICYDRDGEIVWQNFLTETFGRYSGYGGRTQTPVVDGDLVIVSFVSSGWGDQAPLRHRYLAFDKKTGDLVWVFSPEHFPYDFNTQSGPVIVDSHGKRLMIAGNASGWIYALDVATGELVWSFQLSKRGLNSTVLYDGGKVYASHSEENLDEGVMGRAVCFDATGTGDLTKTAEVWRIDELQAGFPTPALQDGILYMIDNSANLHAIDAGDGTILWKHSVGTVGKGSPVLADGKMYVTETNGRFHILKPTRKGVEVLDSDELSMLDPDEVEGLTREQLEAAGGNRYAEIYGSAAIANGRIYFVTEGGLYCLGDKSAPYTPGPASDRPRPKQSKESPVAMQVVPAEVLIEPGETARFALRLVDAAGAVVPPASATWKLAGLEGDVDKSGAFTADTGTPYQTGRIEARVGDLSAAARVRVIPPLPWSMSFDSLEEGQTPTYWINAAKKFVVADLDGEKVLLKAPRSRGLNRSATYLGPSDLSNYTIRARIRGEAKGRRRPDIGLINGGYTLDLQGAHQRLEIRSWAAEKRMAREIAFAWEMGRWYHMIMRVDTDSERAVIRGKVWPVGEKEPADWTITAEDALPIAGGSPGLIGYSPANMYYDDVEVMVND